MHLTKHHGLGNDFLVVIDHGGRSSLSPDDVVAACHRTRGVGADGLLVLSDSPEADLEMVLRNADGSRAEMSGNGICCAGQAALLAGIVDGPTISIDSDVGLKTLTLCAQAAPNRHTLRVDLGTIDLGGAATEWLGEGIAQAEWVNVGNPHLVLGVDAHDAIDLVALGRRVNEAVPGGANVETVALGAGADDVTMRVYERGVGLTDACGTGACASAAAAQAWGLVGDRVVVHQPGGTATIDLGPTVRYTVEVEAVARIEWPWA